MNCPNCGTPTISDQEFCRSCGVGLWANEPRSRGVFPIVGVLLAFGGIIIALTGTMLLHEQILVFIGVVTSIIGMMSIAMIPMNSARRAKKHTRRTAQPAALAPAEPTMKLPPMKATDSIPSVIDNTTELLKEPAPNHSNSIR